MNLFDIDVSDGRNIRFDGTSIPVPENISEQLLSSKGKLTLGIRPEYIKTFSKDEKGCISGKVKLVEDNWRLSDCNDSIW